MAIRINADNDIFTGGELIELKDSQNYSIASFNSTIPTGKKAIESIVTSTMSELYQQMITAGDDVFSLPERDVYYLVRGRQKRQTKVCLIHGSFFETIKAETLIQQAFSQVLEERLADSNFEISEQLKVALVQIFGHHESFSKVRDVANASVKLRFRIMTEAKSEGNILNQKHYPDVEHNTLNFIVPADMDEQSQQQNLSLRNALSQTEFSSLKSFTIKHPLNGYFLCFQSSL